MTYQLCTQDSKKSGITPFTKSTLFANFVIFIENLNFTQTLFVKFWKPYPVPQIWGGE